jgi:hypothetical protein
MAEARNQSSSSSDSQTATVTDATTELLLTSPNRLGHKADNTNRLWPSLKNYFEASAVDEVADQHGHG